MATDHPGDVDAALAAVAARAWTVLASGDVNAPSTWDEAFAWVRLGQRIAADRDPVLVAGVQQALPLAPMALQ